jgi:phosphomannomutase
VKIRTLTLTIAPVAIVAFISLSWGVTVTTTASSLGIATVQVPLRAVIPRLSTLSTAIFLVFVTYSKTSGFIRERHHSRETRAKQELVDNAETSRFSELWELLELKLKRLAHLYVESKAIILARLEPLAKYHPLLDKNVGHARCAPGNGAPIGGLKVVAESGWFAARPSGTENTYKIRAESFLEADQLRRNLEEAQMIVNDALAAVQRPSGLRGNSEMEMVS